MAGFYRPHPAPGCDNMSHSGLDRWRLSYVMLPYVFTYFRPAHAGLFFRRDKMSQSRGDRAN